MNKLINDLIVTQTVRTLEAMNANMDKASAFAKERNFDENLYLNLRLTVDMLPFTKQVQIATDTAKGCVARLSGKTAPVFEDNETTLAQLKDRVTKTINFVNEFKHHDFTGWESKEITFAYVPGKKLTGYDYLMSHAIPNLHFHTTTMYGLLRAHGVQIGKKDYLGNQPWQNA